MTQRGFFVSGAVGRNNTANGLQNTAHAGYCIALVGDPENAQKNPKAKPSHCAPLWSSFHDRFSAQSITRASYHKINDRTLDSDATRVAELRFPCLDEFAQTRQGEQNRAM